MNFRFDPMHRERYKSHTMAKIEFFYRFHQANITLLNQVFQRQSIAAVSARNVCHITQLRHDQFPCSVKILVHLKTLEEFSFFLCREHRNLLNGIQIALQSSGT